MKRIVIDKDILNNCLVEDTCDIGAIVLDCKLLYSDSRGIYIPRDFAKDECLENCFNAMGRTQTELDESYEVLMNPNHESYWDEWRWIVDNCYWIDSNKVKWTFQQDGDLFMVARLCDNWHLLEGKIDSVAEDIAEEYGFDVDEAKDHIKAFVKE